MLDVRLLYSALVDADYIETAAHFDRPSTLPPAPPLSPGVALSILRTYAQSLRTSSNANDTVNDIRSALFAACCHAGAQPTGLFTLTAPTGAGKTLAMLAFALSHALRHGLRRIIVVLPYLTLTEQTATVYETVFGTHAELGTFERYVIEDHSLAGTRHVTEEAEEPDLDGAHVRGRMGEAPTWDAPVVITTSVQMLESLFASRPRPCRKVHYLPQSVILFDEVQTLPLGLAIPTLATLSHLAKTYGSTVVFSTATQPAFTHLDQHVRRYGTAGWAPCEIVPEHRAFFTSMKRRISLEWPNGEHSTWPQVAEEMLNHGEALCVVNLKRHAAALFSVLSSLDQDGLFHLSTNMCALHRQDVLRKVRARLEVGQPCRLVATQCVEAGVDLDFPCVLRALGPLDAIAQAAGRCNRNGRLDLGLVRIFVPEDEGYPDASYQRATSITRALLRASGPEGPSLQDPATYEHYYRTLYDLSQPEKSKEQLLEALRQQDFQEVSRLYRVIPSDAVNVVVPYDQSAFDALASAAAGGNVDGRWVQTAHQHSVSIFKPRADDPVFSCMSSVILVGGAHSEQWFLWNGPDGYDERVGLIVPSTSRCIIA
jgi:CRISPR-associated helicase Cas3